MEYSVFKVEEKKISAEICSARAGLYNGLMAWLDVQT